MITNLTLDNFKRHKHLDLVFTNGLNLITGPNYSGKSTILHAILFALGGARAVPGGKAVVAHRDGGTTHVQLCFMIGDDIYVVERKGSSASVYKNTELQAKSSSAVNNYLTELLGMDMKRFQQLRYGEQKATEALLTLGATELHKIIQEVSQVEVVEKAIGYCSSVATQTRGSLDVMPVEDLSAMEERMQGVASDLHTRYDALGILTKNVDGAKLKLEELNEQLVEQTRENAKRQETRDYRDRLHKDLALIQDTLEQLPTTVVNSDDITADIDETVASMEEMMQDKSAAETKVNALAQAAGEVSHLESRAHQTEQLLTTKQGELAEQGPEADVGSFRLLLADAKLEERTLETEISKITTALKSSVCPTCQRPYEADPEHLEQMQAEASELEGRLSKARQSVRKLTLDVEQAETYNTSRRKTQEMALRYAETLEAQRADLEQARGRHAGLLKGDWGAVFEAVTERVEWLKSELSRLQTLKQTVVETETRAASCYARIGEIEQALEATPEPEPVVPLEGLTKERDEAARLSDAALSAYHSASSEYSRLYEAYNQDKDRLEKAKAVEEKRLALAARHETAKGLSKYLKGNRDRFVGDVWDGILGYASQFAAGATGNAITEVHRTEGGSFGYLEDGEAMPIEAASGAQKSIMGLGVQLALAQMLPSDLRVLLLDEPSSDMDAEHSLTLASLLSAEQGQLLMVSHRELDGAAAVNTIQLGG